MSKPGLQAPYSTGVAELTERAQRHVNDLGLLVRPAGECGQGGNCAKVSQVRKCPDRVLASADAVVLEQIQQPVDIARGGEALGLSSGRAEHDRIVLTAWECRGEFSLAGP
jgi:hypothetical protein